MMKVLEKESEYAPITYGYTAHVLYVGNYPSSLYFTGQGHLTVRLRETTEGNIFILSFVMKSRFVKQHNFKPIVFTTRYEIVQTPRISD